MQKIIPERIVFRKFPEGDVIAIFPDIQEADGKLLSYQRLGQHGSCCPGLIEELDKPDPQEARELLMELALLYKLHERQP